MKKNIDVINSLIKSINDKNLGAMDNLFSEEVVLEWPQSGERIVGNSNRREIYNRFPYLPSVKPFRFKDIGNLLILEAELIYENNDKYLCVFIFELENGLITKEIAYWSKAFPAPEWRKTWVEKI